MNLRKYLVLAGVTVFAPLGDSFLSYGMKQVGNISLRNIPDLLLAIANPWVGIGIIFLLGFFASYMTAFLASRGRVDKNMLLTMKREFCHDSSRYRRQKLYI